VKQGGSITRADLARTSKSAKGAASLRSILFSMTITGSACSLQRILAFKAFAEKGRSVL
jgi:hypothetical protein